MAKTTQVTLDGKRVREIGLHRCPFMNTECFEADCSLWVSKAMNGVCSLRLIAEVMYTKIKP